MPDLNSPVIVDDDLEDSTIATLDASRSDLLTCAVRPEVKLKAILEITRNISSTFVLDTLAPRILDSLMEIFPQAERSVLALVRPDDPKRTIRQNYHKARQARRTAFRPGAQPDEPRISISRSILNQVIGLKKAVLSQDASADKNLPTSASIADLKICSIMCAPLLTPDGAALGILQLDTSDRRQFNQEDLDLLLAVASQAAIAIQNANLHASLLQRERLDRDLRLAEQVQKRFLPQACPIVPNYEFFAHYHAAYEVGGDYYDFVPLPGGRIAIALGDVAGKGVSAALMMAKFSGDTRYAILTEGSPAAAAHKLNELLCLAGIDDRFITLCLAILDPATHELSLCLAGHPPLLIRRADGSVEQIGHDSAGMPLGIFPDNEYKQLSVGLSPGDVVVLYSDGVTDARSPADELFDSNANHRLNRTIADARGTPEMVGKTILQNIREFVASHAQADDITLLTFGLLQGTPESTTVL
jgi:serine phosphatase RsbU (regulator of sigma subunit)